MTDDNSPYFGDHFTMCINIQITRCTPETNVLLYLNTFFLSLVTVKYWFEKPVATSQLVIITITMHQANI